MGVPPLINRCNVPSALQAAGAAGGAAGAEAVAAELQLVAAVLQFALDACRSPRHPAAALLEAAWPALMQVAASPLCAQHPQVRSSIYTCILILYRFAVVLMLQRDGLGAQRCAACLYCEAAWPPLMQDAVSSFCRQQYTQAALIYRRVDLAPIRALCGLCFGV